MKMSAQNLRVLPAPKIWRPKLPFRVFLRRYHDLSANVFGAKCTIDRQEKVSIYEESPSISSKLGELWPKNGKLLMFARLLQFSHGAHGAVIGSQLLRVAIRHCLVYYVCMHAFNKGVTDEKKNLVTCCTNEINGLQQSEVGVFIGLIAVFHSRVVCNRPHIDHVSL